MTGMTNGKIATREDILAAKDRRVEVVAIPGWGHVRMLEMTAEDRLAWETEDDGKVDATERMLRLLIRVIVDENDQKLFSAADIPVLKQRSGRVLIMLCDHARRLNAMTQETTEAIRGN